MREIIHIALNQEASRILIFGVNILCSIPNNVLEKKNLVSKLISYVHFIVL